MISRNINVLVWFIIYRQMVFVLIKQYLCISDNRRSPNRRAPVLLSCGHGCCETCAQSALLYICSLCNEVLLALILTDLFIWFFLLYTIYFVSEILKKSVIYVLACIKVLVLKERNVFINHQKTRVIRGQLPKHLYIFGLVAESYSLPINLE